MAAGARHVAPVVVQAAGLPDDGCNRIGGHVVFPRATAQLRPTARRSTSGGLPLLCAGGHRLARQRLPNAQANANREQSVAEFEHTGVPNFGPIVVAGRDRHCPLTAGTGQTARSTVDNAPRRRLTEAAPQFCQPPHDHPHATLDELAEPLRGHVAAYVERLRAICGAELLAVTFYGPLWRPAPGEHSSLSNAAVFGDVDLEMLARIARDGHRFGRSGIAAPWALTERLIADSLDTFPLELIEIAAQPTTVFGPDLFSPLSSTPCMSACSASGS